MTTEDKKVLKAIIKEALVETHGYIDIRLKESKESTDTLVAKLNKESKESTDILIKKLNEESEEKIKHYIGGIQEQYNWNIAAILENTKGQQAANEKIDILFENMGKQEVDIEVLKESARDHERRLQKIER